MFNMKKKKDFLFDKSNYKYVIIGILFIIIGWFRCGNGWFRCAFFFI